MVASSGTGELVQMRNNTAQMTTGLEKDVDAIQHPVMFTAGGNSNAAMKAKNN